MASLGLLGLIVPKELGGLGQSHVCAAMVVETIARYGCSSTAMVYGEWVSNKIILLANSVKRVGSETVRGI